MIKTITKHIKKLIVAKLKLTI